MEKINAESARETINESQFEHTEGLHEQSVLDIISLNDTEISVSCVAGKTKLSVFNTLTDNAEFFEIPGSKPEIELLEVGGYAIQTDRGWFKMDITPDGTHIRSKTEDQPGATGYANIDGLVITGSTKTKRRGNLDNFFFTGETQTGSFLTIQDTNKRGLFRLMNSRDYYTYNEEFDRVIVIDDTPYVICTKESFGSDTIQIYPHPENIETEKSTSNIHFVGRTAIVRESAISLESTTYTQFNNQLVSYTAGTGKTQRAIGLLRPSETPIPHYTATPDNIELTDNENLCTFFEYHGNLFLVDVEHGNLLRMQLPEDTDEEVTFAHEAKTGLTFGYDVTSCRVSNEKLYIGMKDGSYQKITLDDLSVMS